MARGRKPNLERRDQAAELRSRGLTLAEIGRKMGCTKQAVHHLLGFRGPWPRPRKPVACPACGGAAGTAPTARDHAPALCLACLGKRPGATFAERLRALRIAAGLSLWALAGRAGLSAWAVRVLEKGKCRPLPGTLRKLAEALSVEVTAFLVEPAPRPRTGRDRSPKATAEQAEGPKLKRMRGRPRKEE
jgi:transcriptional regulator with XRE-family HTH domain